MDTLPKLPTTTIHAIFLDVDGTYADYGVVPEAHERAVRAARAAGHKVFLCTGRPLSMLPASILAAGFDGLVASAGAYVQVGDRVLMDRRFSEEQASRTIAALDAHDAIYVLESAEFLHVRPAAEQRLRDIVGSHFAARPDGQSDGASAILGTLRLTPAPASYAKVSVFDAAASVAMIAAEIGNDIAVVENSIADTHRHTGEIFLRGISKADGIALAIEDLGISQAHTIAIGDGENDLEMVAYAGIGIAVEGSHPGLVALADRTTPPPSKDGVAVAFAELGLF